MPLQTGYQDPFTSARQGFAQGMQMAQSRAEQKMKKTLANLETGYKMLSMKGIPNEQKVDIYNNTVLPNVNMMNPGNPIQPLKSWGKDTDAMFKDAVNIFKGMNDGTIPAQEGLTGIMTLNQRAGEDITEQMKSLEKEAGGLVETRKREELVGGLTLSADPQEAQRQRLQVMKEGTLPAPATQVVTTGEDIGLYGKGAGTKLATLGKPPVTAGAGVGKKARPAADVKLLNRTNLTNILAGSDVEVKEIFNDATGTVNEALLKQKLRQEGDLERYGKWSEIKQLSQRMLRDTELTYEDISVQAFKDAGAEHLLSGYVEPKKKGEGRLPKGSTAGKELMEFEPGKQGYEVRDTDGNLIGYDWVK